MSWATPTTPLPTEVNPRMAFERLFGDGASSADRLNDRKRNISILDSVTRELASFKKNIAPDDRVKLNDYVENVREIERRVQNVTQSPRRGSRSKCLSGFRRTRTHISN
jgi:hypothetical protein